MNAFLLIHSFNALHHLCAHDTPTITQNHHDHPDHPSSLPSMAESFNAQHTVALWCPVYIRIASPVDKSHSRAVQSELALTR